MKQVIRQRILGNPKIKFENLDSEIYEIKYTDFDAKYVYHTRPPILQQVKEHYAHIKYGR